MIERRWHSLPGKVPKLLLAALALALGGLLGVIVASPALDSLGAPASRLTTWLLPLAGVGLILALTVRDPLAGLLLAVLLAPYSKHIPLDFSLGSGIPDLSLSRLMAGFLLLWLLVQSVRGERRLARPRWAEVAFAVFLVALLLSVPESQYDRVFALQSIMDAYLIPVVFFYLARQLVRNGRDLDRYTGVLLLAGASFAFLVIREQVTGQVLLHSREAERYSQSFQKVISLMGNAAPMGLSTAMALPPGLVLLASLFRRPATTTGLRLLRVLVPAGLAFVALGVYMTYNRGSWLGVVITVAVFLALRPHTRRFLLPLLLVAAVLAGVFWQDVVNSSAVNERLLQGASLDYRGTVARLALDMVKDDPLFGLGYYNFGPIAKQRYGWDPTPLFGIYPPAHNSYMFVLVSGGLLALLPYLAWFALLGWHVARRYAALARGAITTATAGRRDALAAAAALLLMYVIGSGAFDNVEATHMNLIFAATMGALLGGARE